MLCLFFFFFACSYQPFIISFFLSFKQYIFLGFSFSLSLSLSLTHENYHASFSLVSSSISFLKCVCVCGERYFKAAQSCISLQYINQSCCLAFGYTAWSCFSSLGRI